MPPAPDELQGKELKIEYVSVLAQAQQQVGLAAIERFGGYVGNLSGLYPEVLNKFDALESVDEIGNMLGVPQKLIVPDDVVQKKMEAQAQQQIAVGAQAAESAKTLSEANTSEQNALTAITGL